MDWTTLNLGKAGNKSIDPDATNVFPNIMLKEALDQQGNAAADIFLLGVQDDRAIALLQTIADNQANIITLLTDILDQNQQNGGKLDTIIGGGIL